MKKTLFFIIPLMALILLFSSCNDQDDSDSMVDLPEVITAYIAENYPDYNIDESEQDTLCDGTVVYEVELEASNDDELELTFDTEGTLLFTETEIKNSDVPSVITDHINANYSSYNLKEAERLDMADGSQQYEVELKDGSNKLEVLYTSDGTVICEVPDND